MNKILFFICTCALTMCFGTLASAGHKNSPYDSYKETHDKDLSNCEDNINCPILIVSKLQEVASSFNQEILEFLFQISIQSNQLVSELSDHHLLIVEHALDYLTQEDHTNTLYSLLVLLAVDDSDEVFDDKDERERQKEMDLEGIRDFIRDTWAVLNSEVEKRKLIFVQGDMNDSAGSFNGGGFLNSLWSGLTQFWSKDD